MAGSNPQVARSRTEAMSLNSGVSLLEGSDGS